MIWVGSFKSLQSALGKPHFTAAELEVRTWVQSEIGEISPLVDWLMNLIAASRCACGEEQLVELALREALSNAIIHGNRLDARKLVHVCCRCEGGNGVFIVVRDQGHGFDPRKVPDPLAFENLRAEHGRGIHLMKLAMDEVSFERQGTEVHMRKASGPKHGMPAWRPHDRMARRLVSRPSPGVRVLELRQRPFASERSQAAGRKYLERQRARKENRDPLPNDTFATYASAR